MDDSGYILGKISSPLDEMNANPSQTGTLYYQSFKGALSLFVYDNFIELGLPPPSPVTPDENVRLWARTAAHEVGHMLGLVAHDRLLGGDRGGHNQFPFPKNVLHMMNPGERHSLYERMGREGSGWSFRPLNAEYLRFILPKQ